MCSDDGESNSCDGCVRRDGGDGGGVVVAVGVVVVVIEGAVVVLVRKRSGPRSRVSIKMVRDGRRGADAMKDVCEE